MHEQIESVDHITLTQATKIAPGRPSTNCMWRWCRKGVRARTGELVRLRHVRAGGKIFTAAPWVEEFCRRLAEADAAYFDGKTEAAKALPPRDARYAPPSRLRKAARPAARRADAAAIDRELDEEGL